MSRLKLKVTPAFALAAVALFVALGGVSAAKSSVRHLIDGNRIKNQTLHHAALADNAVWHANLAPNSVQANNLTDALMHKINAGGPRGRRGARGPAGPRGRRGATGPQGPAGPQGPKGDTGATGARGPQGDHGQNGKNGQDGKSYLTDVTALSADGWTAYDDTNNDGTTTIDASGVELGGPVGGGLASVGDDYAGVVTHQFDNLTPNDIAQLSYTESYTDTPDANREAPYFKFKLQPSGGECGGDDVVYNPSVQSHNLDYADATENFSVTDLSSTVGIDNHDANPVDGPYAAAIHSDVTANDPICATEIVLGGGSPGTHPKATIKSVSIETTKQPLTVYQFGSSPKTGH